MKWARSSALRAPLFVVLSGSGFVGARLGLPHADPFIFLAWRFALASGLLLLLARWLAAPWPTQARAWLDIALAGLLAVGVFSGGVFYGIAHGMPPALSALIIALQPLLIATVAPRWLGETVSRRCWAGLLLAFGGVVLVLANDLSPQTLNAQPLVASFLALFAICGGNLYQKARCREMHPFSGGAIQCAVSAAGCAGLGHYTASRAVDWHPDFWLALGWMSVVVSVGAVSLLVSLLREQSISQVARWFYLLPVAAVAGAWWLFGQTLTPWQGLGMLITGCGVWWAGPPASEPDGDRSPKTTPVANARSAA